jgi:hypothetical protein
LMPDIFVPLCALALYLLAFRGRQLNGLEMLGLGAVVAFAMASHMAILGMALIVLLGFAIVHCLPGGLALPRPGMVTSTAAVGAGIALAVFSNLMIAGVFSFTPGGSSFLFARLIQDGIIARYLHDRCPDPEIRLCAFRRELPNNTDDWMWTGDSPLVKLGGWKQFEPEAKYIIHDTLRRYPYAHLAAAVRDTVTQVVSLRTGDGITADNNWHVEWVFREHAPHALELYYHSAQSRNALHFTAINALQVPVALLATAVLPLLFVMLLRRRPAAAMFVLTMMMALLANAAICGVFAGPGSRYQSRLVPVAILAVLIAGGVLRRPTDRLPQSKAAGQP